ncbi:MAG: ATP-binding protein [Candidatus Pacebacteria bacterium]|nr:ATP-binding protein [Candidatus Paceibacterota bacterium]
MTFFSISALINFIVSLGSGVFILRKNRDSKVYRSFALFCLSVAIWSGFYFLWQVSTDASSALFFSRALMAAAIWIPLLYFIFTLRFLDQYEKWKRFVYVGIAVFSVFFVANFTQYFVEGVAPALSFKFWPTPGILFLPFLVLWFAYLAGSTLLLFREFMDSTGLRREQASIILVGITSGFVAGTTNYLMWYGIPIPPYGNVLVSVYVGLSVYALVKSYLFNIQLLTVELLVFLISGSIFANLILRKNTEGIVFDIGILVFVIIVGTIIIKSVLKESKRKLELQELSEKLKEANLRLQEIDHMKSEFVATTAHELRTPLSAAKWAINMVLSGEAGEINEEQKELLDKGYQSSERITKLVNNLLNTSRMESGKFQYEFKEESLDEILSSIHKSFEQQAKDKNITLNYTHEEKPLPNIMLDAEKLKTAIENLVDNAMKYTEPGDKIEIISRTRDGVVYIDIVDTGIGIPERQVPQLFSRFFRAKNAVKVRPDGTGLGLYISKQIVEKHGGRIWINSKEGEGTEVHITLPQNAEPEKLTPDTTV